MKLNALGKHVLIELYNCDVEIIKNHEMIQEIMNEAAKVAGCTIVNSLFHKFNPYGVSGAVIVQESHLTIHTWPEYGYVAIDIFVCGNDVYPFKAQKYLENMLKSTKSESTELFRGINDKIDLHKESNER